MKESTRLGIVLRWRLALRSRLALRTRFALRLGIALGLSACAASPARAAFIDVGTLFSNTGFENGNLGGWTLTQPNANYVSSLSPPVNPFINPADSANNPSTLTAPAGSFFTGVQRVGDTGPDLAFKLAHDAIAIAVPTGTAFQITVFANRGRLEPFDTPGSTADVNVRIFGWTGGTTIPTVDPTDDDWSRTINWNGSSATAQGFDFTSVLDGQWGSQTFTFDPAAAGIDAANLKYLAISITGITHNHDQYVAVDVGPVPAPGALALLAMGLLAPPSACDGVIG